MEKEDILSVEFIFFSRNETDEIDKGLFENIFFFTDESERGEGC